MRPSLFVQMLVGECLRSMDCELATLRDLVFSIQRPVEATLWLHMIFATTATSQLLIAPAGESPLIAAAQWLQGTLLGTIATAVAIIAVATTGMMMLTGHVDWRRGVSVVLGCFIIFGAPVIAAGILGAVDERTPYVVPPEQAPSPIDTAPPQAQPSSAPVPYDPYAGASVPTG
jgi:type IV secretory pathway VirB2 component (pilin)